MIYGEKNMRLIDADKLKEHIKRYTIHSGIQVSLNKYALKVIEEEPTVDAVPVIRCSECRHSYETLPTVYRYLMCSHGVCVDCIVDEDFYCAMAERKEHETD